MHDNSKYTYKLKQNMFIFCKLTKFGVDEK